MIESSQQPQPPKLSEPAVELSDNNFLVDAALIGELLRISAAHVPTLMREGKITSTRARSA